MAAQLASLFTCFLFAADPPPAANFQINPASIPVGGPPVLLSPSVPDNARSAVNKVFLIVEIAEMFFQGLAIVDLTCCLGVCRSFHQTVRTSSPLRPLLFNEVVRDVQSGKQMEIHPALQHFSFQPVMAKRLRASFQKPAPSYQAGNGRKWFRLRCSPLPKPLSSPRSTQKRLYLASKNEQFAWQVNTYRYRTRGCEIMFTRRSIVEEEERLGTVTVVPRTSVLYDSFVRPGGYGLKVHQIDENDVIGGLYFDTFLDHDDYVSLDGATIGEILDDLEDSFLR